ncbi:hypothetical protein GCM10027347_34120 [Larkinella harenae]
MLKNILKRNWLTGRPKQTVFVPDAANTGIHKNPLVTGVCNIVPNHEIYPTQVLTPGDEIRSPL